MDILQRIRISELSAVRILNFIRNKLVFGTNFLRYRLSEKSSRRVKEEKDKYLGECLLLVCNGPSLNDTDLSAILDTRGNMRVMTMNRAYIAFTSLGLKPDFHVAINDLVLSQYERELSVVKCKKFYKFGVSDLLDSDDEVNSILIKEKLSDIFCYDVSTGITSGGTVTYVCLQLAFYLGFREVIICGMDHSFASTGEPNKTETRSGSDEGNHFHPDYFPSGSRWQLPDLRRSEIAYERARKAYEASGRRIYDATVRGKCQIFQKFSAVDAVEKSDGRKWGNEKA